MCLDETSFEWSQAFISSTARSVRQRNNIPRSVGVLVRALGGRDRGQGSLLLAVVLCLAICACALVGLGEELQLSFTPLLRA